MCRKEYIEKKEYVEKKKYVKERRRESILIEREEDMEVYKEE